MTTQERRNVWRAYCIKTLQQFDVSIHPTPSGASRLIGLHGDITVRDVADLTKFELSNFTRIRT